MKNPDLLLPDYDQRAEASFLFDRFKPWHSQNKHPHSIPTVCSQMKDNYLDGNGIERRNCLRNSIMADGLHWCMNSIGPRYHAGVSCLLGCAYNTENVDSKGLTNGELEQCEKACNDQFMSLVPLDESWLQGANTLFSIVS